MTNRSSRNPEAIQSQNVFMLVGTIVQMNQKTATFVSKEGEWRVSCSFLHRIVEV